MPASLYISASDQYKNRYPHSRHDAVAMDHELPSATTEGVALAGTTNGSTSSSPSLSGAVSPLFPGTDPSSDVISTDTTISDDLAVPAPPLLRRRRKSSNLSVNSQLQASASTQRRVDSGLWLGCKAHGTEKGERDSIRIGNDDESNSNINRNRNLPWGNLRRDTFGPVPMTVGPLAPTPSSSPILQPSQLMASALGASPQCPHSHHLSTLNAAMLCRMSSGTYRMWPWDESAGAYMCTWTPRNFEDEIQMQTAVRDIDAREKSRKNAVLERHVDVVEGATERMVRREGGDEMGQGIGGKAVRLSSVAARRLVVDLLVQQGGEEWRAELEATIGVEGEEDQRGRKARLRAGLNKCVENIKGCLGSLLGRK